MKNLFNCLVAMMVALLATACSSEEEKNIPVDNDVLKSFSILKSLNEEMILTDGEAIITPGKISLVLDKYDCLSGLVATFVHEGVSVTVNGKEQVSGVTHNDFSQPLTYTVETKNGGKVDYVVSIILQENQPITRFEFLKSVNNELPKDFKCVLTDNSILSFFTFKPNVLIPTFETIADIVMVNGEVQKSGVSSQDFSVPVVYDLVMRNGEKLSYKVKADYLLAAVPQVHINTIPSSLSEIESKDYYVDATLDIDGKGVYENYSGETEIKGRGNSTWNMPKKPYRLKLKKKASLCGFGQAKNYVLLANYIDPTLMLNAVAFKMGHLLDMPFTNHVVPVDVFLNGNYKGSYMMTEQIEVKENRIDLDENNSVVWEFDTNYDEELKFISDAYALPVMVKDPDMTYEKFEYWKNDLNVMMRKMAEEPLEGNSYVDMIDIESVAKYILIYSLTHNMEINHPKSIYMHKEGNGKYVMGPIWDFDWAFDYEGDLEHFNHYNVSLWNENMTNGVGTRFFQRFLKDSRVRKIYKEVWDEFYANKFELLLNYVDEYAKVLKTSVEEDSRIWSNTRNFESKVKTLKNWLRNRAVFINKEVEAM